MFFRVEHQGKYDLGRALNLSITPYGETLNQFVPHQDIYQRVLDEAWKSEESLKAIIERIARSKSELAAFIGGGAAFWAYLCEKVRLNCYPDRPSRLTCVFALREIEDANKLIKVFESESASLQGGRPWKKRDQVVYRVECVRPQDDRVYDMSLYDSLSGAMTHGEAVERLLAYWDGDQSQAPIPECLLVGETYRGEIVRTFR